MNKKIESILYLLMSAVFITAAFWISVNSRGKPDVIGSGVALIYGICMYLLAARCKHVKIFKIKELNTKEIDSEFVEIVNNNFWELF